METKAPAEGGARCGAVSALLPSSGLGHVPSSACPYEMNGLNVDGQYQTKGVALSGGGRAHDPSAVMPYEANGGDEVGQSVCETKSVVPVHVCATAGLLGMDASMGTAPRILVGGCWPGSMIDTLFLVPWVLMGGGWPGSTIDTLFLVLRP